MEKLTETVLSLVAGYVTQFVIYTLLIAMLFLLFALLLYWLCNKKGWTRITETGPAWFRIVAIIATAATGLTLGIVIGFQVSLTNVGVNMLDEVGPAILEVALQKAIKPLGLSDIYEEIDVRNANNLLEEIDGIELVDSSGLKAMLIRGTFDKIRSLIVQKAKKLVNDYAPDDTIIPADLVLAVWADACADIRSANRSYTFSKLLIGVVLLLLILTCFALITLLMRYIIAKAANVFKRA